MLSDMIDKFLVDRESNKKRSRLNKAGKPKFYPSSLGRCRRFNFYSMMGYERPEPPPHVTRILDNGTSMHERYEQLFADMGILLAAEVVFNEESEDEAIRKFCEKYRVSGRSDAVIRIDDTVYIVELKSANDKQFGYMVKNNEPKEEHYRQIQLYMHITGIHQGIILVENKNTQALWEYHVTYDPEYVTKSILENEIEYVNDHIDREEVPPRDFEKTSFECRYCDFRNVCWASEQRQGLYTG